MESIGRFILTVIAPFNLFLLLLLFSGIFLYLQKQKYALITWCATAIFLLFISTPFLPVPLVSHLERQYPVFDHFEQLTRDPVVNILVLGGGHSPDPSLPPNDQLSHNALGRLTEGLRLHNQLSNSRLILSGYSASGSITQAEVLYRTALLLGTEKETMIMQKVPGNTCEEAKVYAVRFDSSIPLVIVTSASHMPRAMYAFLSKGINAIPAPTNHILKNNNQESHDNLLPHSRNIRMLDTAIHEYVGMLWYKLSRCK